MGRAHSAYGGRRGIYRVLMGKTRERDHLGDLCIDGRIILDNTSGNGVWGYGLNQDRDR